MAKRAIKATPSVSTVAEAAATVVNPGRKPSNIAPFTGGGKAMGAALADKVWEDSQGEQVRWTGHFCNIVKLDTDGRKQFRSTLSARKAALAEMNKTAKIRSNLVRISESMTVSYAADKGMTLQNVADAWNEKGIGESRTAEQLPHGFFVQYARAYRNEKAGVGNTARQGRVPMTDEQKLQAYILRTFSAKFYRKAEKIVKMLADTVRTEKQRDAMLHPAPVNSGTAEDPATNKKQASVALKNAVLAKVAAKGKSAAVVH